ncbi:unnamed protein product [Merluccius merluccius]
MSCLDVMYHQSYGAHYLPASQVAAAAAYKAAYYGHHHHHHHQRKPSAYSKVQECVEQQMYQQLQQSRAAGMLPREQGLRRASLAPGSRCSGGGGGGVSCARGGGSPEDFIVTKDSSSSQPAEAEYLSARCVLFTYFQGSIGDVVDEHFSRALSQSGAFARETKPLPRATQQQQQPSAPLPGALWKDGASLSEGQCSPIIPTNMWSGGGAYPSQAGPCLPSPSVSVHPDFSCSGSPLPFHPADGALWPGHALAQAGLPPDSHPSWSYGLNAGQGGAGSGYPQIHDIYHPHYPASAHAHGHHGHRFSHMLHSFQPHGPAAAAAAAAAAALDPRFSPLLLPGVRQRAPSTESHGSSPPPPALSDGVKTEIDPSISIPVAATSAMPASWSPVSLHGSMEVYDSGLDQEKAKASAWF